jgi:hypothetical protein
VTFNLRNLQRGEWVAMAGGAVLALALFLTWYDAGSANATIADRRGPTSLSAWEVHHTLRFLLLAAAAAPFILAWIVIREHELSWPRGEVTSVVAIAAAGLIFYNGVIDRPGEPASDIHLRWGWFIALAGAALMFLGAVIRQAEVQAARRPPGVLR